MNRLPVLICSNDEQIQLVRIIVENQGLSTLLARLDDLLFHMVSSLYSLIIIISDDSDYVWLIRQIDPNSLVVVIGGEQSLSTTNTVYISFAEIAVRLPVILNRITSTQRGADDV